MRTALIALLLLSGCSSGAAASPVSPSPTTPATTLPPAPPRSVLADVRAAVGQGRGAFDVLLVDAETAVATDDRSWAATVRFEAGTWKVTERAALG